MALPLDRLLTFYPDLIPLSLRSRQISLSVLCKSLCVSRSPARLACLRNSVGRSLLSLCVCVPLHQTLYSCSHMSASVFARDCMCTAQKSSKNWRAIEKSVWAKFAYPPSSQDEGLERVREVNRSLLLEAIQRCCGLALKSRCTIRGREGKLTEQCALWRERWRE